MVYILSVLPQSAYHTIHLFAHAMEGQWEHHDHSFSQDHHHSWLEGFNALEGDFEDERSSPFVILKYIDFIPQKRFSQNTQSKLRHPIRWKRSTILSEWNESPFHPPCV